MIKYKLTTLAQQDLESIWHYTARNWSVNQAAKYINGLLSTIDAIADRRIKGKAINLIRTGYKKALYEKHYIFFRLSSNDVIEIIRVLHVSMDVETHL